MQTPLYIIREISNIVEQVSLDITPQLQDVNSAINGVHFLAGHKNEIRERLSKMNTGKYPLIALFQDFIERRGKTEGVYCEATLQMIVLHHTAKTDYTEDRYTKVFEPILYPIYLQFLKRLSQHPLLIELELQNDKIDRPHWGIENKDGNTDYIFNDILDGVELRNLKLKFKQPLPVRCSGNTNQILSWQN